MKPGLHHICLSVTNLKTSLAFYDSVMPRLGFRKRKTEKSTAYALDTFEIYLQESKKSSTPYQRFTAGLQHMAFHAPSKSAVDELFRDLQEIKVSISDPPADYPQYSPGYYAVYFQDPDGITLEYCYTPDFEF